jgi:hypothetical protein
MQGTSKVVDGQSVNNEEEKTPIEMGQTSIGGLELELRRWNERKFGFYCPRSFRFFFLNSNDSRTARKRRTHPASTCIVHVHKLALKQTTAITHLLARQLVNYYRWTFVRTHTRKHICSEWWQYSSTVLTSSIRMGISDFLSSRWGDNATVLGVVIVRAGIIRHGR